MSSGLLFDLRDAWRSLTRDRGYSATVILTFALTIGATTAMFSMVDGVLLRPLAYRESHRLVAIREVWRQFVGRAPTLEVNERHFEYWRAHARTFDSLAQYILTTANLTHPGEPAEIVAVHTSGSLFEVLQVSAALGRTLVADDERGSRPDVAVITDRLWRQRLNADPAAIGRAIDLDGRPFTVVGVLPSGFALPQPGDVTAKVDVFVPIRMDAEHVGWAGDHNNQAIGRLKAGATADEARAELDVLQTQVSELASKEMHEAVTLASAVSPLTDTVVGRARAGLLMLLAAIVAVLLIACSNLANLSLTRTVSHTRDAAIRVALGADRRRLVRRALFDQMLLSGAGGLLGIGVAWTALAIFIRTAPLDLPRVHEVTLDGRVLAFAALVSIASGLLVAILPAWRAAGQDAQPALRAASITVSGDPAGMRTRAGLLILQVALSVALLVTTALLGLSFVRLASADRGFIARDVLAVRVAMPAARYAETARRLAAWDRILAAVRAVPGVESVTTSSMLPLAGQGQINFIAAEGSTKPRSEQPAANFRYVAPDYFQTLGVPLLRGRAFRDDEREPGRPTPVVISLRTATRLWPNSDAVGKRLSRGLPDERGFEVVGIAADARTTSLDTPPPLMVYVPYWWSPFSNRASMPLLIKSAVPQASLLPAVRRAVHEIDAETAIGEARPLEDLVDASIGGRRYQMRLFAAFAAIALFIATIGVYSVTAYAVSRRRREMNIRVALGARPWQALRLIVVGSAGPIGIGLACGAAGAVAVGAAVANQLFEVKPRDPVVLAVVVALVGAVGLTASLVAARQALAIDPVSALHDE